MDDWLEDNFFPFVGFMVTFQELFAVKLQVGVACDGHQIASILIQSFPLSKIKGNKKSQHKKIWMKQNHHQGCTLI